MSRVLSGLSAWTPLTLVGLIAGYAIVATALVLAPIVAPVLREAWQARREHREATYVLFRSYPSYLLRHRRKVRGVLIVPPVLLVLAWIWARVS